MAFETRRSLNMELFDLGKPDRSPVIVSYGLGVDSTAMLVRMARLGEKPDLIIFADTGAEKAATMAYLPVIQDWLVAVGFPPVTVVRRKPCHGKHGYYETLEQECFTKEMFPSLAYHRNHSCATKWKVEPSERLIRGWQPAIRAWSYGMPVIQCIGFENEKHEIARCNRLPDSPKYSYRMPLIEWGWDRARCVAEIESDSRLKKIAERHGVPVVPPKSACYFCPASKPEELVQLKRAEPELFARAIELERMVAPKLLSLKGLWGRATKSRPASWTEFATGHELLTGDEAKYNRVLTTQYLSQPPLK
jgi:hypothetical protein